MCQRWLLYAYADVASARNRRMRCVGTREAIVAEGNLPINVTLAVKEFLRVKINRIEGVTESPLCASLKP